jgi:hypothetical protein
MANRRPTKCWKDVEWFEGKLDRKQELVKEHRNPSEHVGWVWLERRSFVDPDEVG